MIAECSKCGEKKVISQFDGPPRRVYCKKCDDWNHEKVTCEKCGEELEQQELADHLLAHHIDE